MNKKSKKNNFNSKKTLGLIILTLIICVIFTLFFTKVFGLDEWIDDYENENYVQWKYNVIRNSTLNCMELNFTSGTTFSYENFTLYTEVDEQSDITVTDYKIEWDSMKRSADSYVAYDKGADYFYEFEHYLNVKITDVEAGDANNRQFACLWYVSTIMGDGDDITADDFIGVYVRQDGINDDKYAFDLRWYQNGVQVGFYDAGDIRDVGTDLYLIMNRFDNDFYLYVYTDSDRTVLDETLSMLNENNDKFRYIGFCGIGDDINDPDDYSSGYIEYLSLDNGKVFENFSDYTEIDPNNHITIISENEINFDAWRNEDAYLYFDYGVNYFGNIEHWIDIRTPVTSDNDAEGELYVLANVVDDFTGIRTGDALRFAFRREGTINTLYFTGYKDGASTQDSYVCTLNTWYFLIIIRVDNDCYCEIYSDSSRTILLDNLTINNAIDVNFRYIYGCSSLNTGHNLDYQDSRTKNLWIGEYISVFGYMNNGIFYTKDILNYVNGSSIVLLTNSTIPENDEIKIQFSPNNSSWYSHNAILTGYDNIVAGLESIDLRDLNYSSSIYMRFNFSDGGSDSTPRLYQIRLITDANVSISIPSDEFGGVGFMVGSLIFTPILFILLIIVFRRRKR